MRNLSEEGKAYLTKKIKTAIFREAFDPFHNGHKNILESLIKLKKFDRVIVMPIGSAAHKERYMTPAGYRYEMTRLGIRGLAGVSLSDYEIDHPEQHLDEPDIINYYKEKLHDDYTKTVKKDVKLEISLIHGSDALDSASAGLREELKLDREQRDKIPTAVGRYIKNNKIYVFSSEMAKLKRKQLIKLAQYEREVRKNVSIFRLNHSLNVMQYAVHLAAVHDYDLMTAAVTGILHDIAKSMKIEEQYRLAKNIDKLNPLNHNIVHGPAGAWYIHHYLGISDQKILDALIFHTTSRENMTKLDKIIYLADKLEYGRPFGNLKKIREIAETDLNSAMKLCLKEVKMSLIRDSKKEHPATIAAQKYLDSHDSQ